ncbi:MAG: alpha/beta fold hydrolase [Pirellulaceae bacterium]|jgi:dienelactone hydrolase|nr:alpha/beta fold hydrolase [Pirellulaceae bacterium]MDP7020446.1 alpha/beta fold hydrolase [Pirellulaceae bacterium]
MQVELIKARTVDGVRLDGALSATDQPSQVCVDAVIAVHGVGSNFYGSGLFERLTTPLLSLGVDVLRVNTRGHDGHYAGHTPGGSRPLGAAYEIVDECRWDIAAWVEVLRKRGAQSIGLIGHSLGAIKSLYAQAHEPSDAVRLVAAFSPPRLSYRVFSQSAKRDEFLATIGAAQQRIEEGRGGELISATFPFPLLIAASAYIDKYGDQERYNIMRFIHKLPCPVLATYGALELQRGSSAFDGLPEAIAELDSPQSIEVACIDDADHLYSGVHDQLAACLVAWLRRRA